MAITTTINNGLNQSKGISYSAITDSSIDWTGITNNTYFYNLEDDLPYYKNGSGTVLSIFSEGGTDTNDYTTGTTLVGTTLYFDRTDSLSAYTADLSSIGDGVYGGSGTVPTSTVATLTDTLTFKGADTSSASSNIKIVDSASASLWDWKNDGSLVGYKSKIQLIAQNNTSGSLTDYVLRLRTVGNGDNLALFANDGFFALGSSNTMAGTSVYSTQFIVGPSNTINRTSGGNSFIVGRGNNLTGNGNNHVIVGTSNTQTGTGVDTLVGSFITAGGTAGATNLFGYSIDGNTYDNINAVGSWVDFNGGNFANLFGIGVASNATGASVIGHGSESNVSVNKLVNSTARSLALGWNTTTPQHLFFQTGAYIGGGSAIGSEKISLQGLTLINDYLIQDANTSAIADGTLVNDSFSFHISSGVLAGRYKDNLGTVSDLTIGEKPTLSKTFTLDAPTASDDVTIFRTDVAITVQEVIAVSVGTSPSTTYQLKHSTDRSSAGNALTTSGTSTSTTSGDVATLSDATIPADSWVWFESTAATGTNVILSIDIRYTED